MLKEFKEKYFILFAFTIYGLAYFFCVEPGIHNLIWLHLSDEGSRLWLHDFLIKLQSVSFMVVFGMLCQKYHNYSKEVKTTIHSIIRICSYCKKIYTKGKWGSVDSFIRQEMKEHNMTHGICEDCLVNVKEEMRIFLEKRKNKGEDYDEAASD